MAIVIAERSLSSAPRDNDNIATTTTFTGVNATLRSDYGLTTPMSDRQRPSTDTTNYATDVADDRHLPQPTQDHDHDPARLPSGVPVPSSECLS